MKLYEIEIKEWPYDSSRTFTIKSENMAKAAEAAALILEAAKDAYRDEAEIISITDNGKLDDLQEIVTGYQKEKKKADVEKEIP